MGLEQTSHNYAKDLKKRGCDSEEGVALVEQFERDKERMKLNLRDELDQLKMSYQKQIGKRSKKWKHRRAEERLEQEKLRLRAQRIIKALLEGQSVSNLTAAEDTQNHNRLLEEREKLLTSIETSVTARKLRSQRQLEEMLYRRQEKKIDKVIKAQQQEFEARERRKQYETEDMSDLDFARALIQERAVKAASGSSVPKKRMEELLWRIEEQLVKEKLEGVKEQEEKMASFLAAKQLKHTRELATIEEHYDRLVKFKLCLLTEMGQKFSSTDSAAVSAKEHKMLKERADNLAAKLLKELTESRQKLEATIEDEKARQNVALQQKIAKRANKKVPGKVGETDTDRLMEAARAQMSVRKIEAQKQQEEEIIFSLASACGLDTRDILSLLMLVFPHNTPEELQSMAVKLASANSQSEATKSIQSEDEAVVAGRKRGKAVDLSGRLDSVVEPGNVLPPSSDKNELEFLESLIRQELSPNQNEERGSAVSESKEDTRRLNKRKSSKPI